jgi:antitoxin (DNA-binding transcriptional repressor) of toxin-antitoxin stability system
MTTVTVDEARAALPELLRRIGAGEKVVITDGGKWVGLLAPPPPMPEADAVRRARAEEAIRTILALREEGPVLPEGVTVQDLLDEQRRCE